MTFPFLLTGVTVYQPMYILNQSEIVIMFASGAGVEVVENKGFMSARVYLPWNHMVSLKIKTGEQFHKESCVLITSNTILLCEA